MSMMKKGWKGDAGKTLKLNIGGMLTTNYVVGVDVHQPHDKLQKKKLVYAKTL